MIMPLFQDVKHKRLRALNQYSAMKNLREVSSKHRDLRREYVDKLSLKDRVAVAAIAIDIKMRDEETVRAEIMRELNG